jgi:hypothetical protein
MCYFGTAEFYNGVRGKDIEGPDANLRDSIHHWADHGIAGRGILLDYRSYAKSKGISYGTRINIPILLHTYKANSTKTLTTAMP